MISVSICIVSAILSIGVYIAFSVTFYLTAIALIEPRVVDVPWLLVLPVLSAVPLLASYLMLRGIEKCFSRINRSLLTIVRWGALLAIFICFNRAALPPLQSMRVSMEEIALFYGYGLPSIIAADMTVAYTELASKRTRKPLISIILPALFIPMQLWVIEAGSIAMFRGVDSTRFLILQLLLFLCQFFIMFYIWFKMITDDPCIRPANAELPP